MSDGSTKTITARFETREAAELAVEHLTQEQGIDRSDVFLQASGRENSVGTSISGGDTASGQQGSRRDAPLDGEIELSADIAADQLSAVQRVLGDAGALRVSSR